MKVALYGTDNKETGKIDLPLQFDEDLRTDLIQLAVLAIQSNRRQPYGAKPGAGMRQEGKLSRRRRDYKGSYGHGISRVPRKILSRAGRRMNWAGAVAPGMKGGRRAHPPKVYKNWKKKINIKERRKAIRSAIAATVNKTIVTARGHQVPEHYPFIIANSIESMSKTKDVLSLLSSIGFEKELERTSGKIIRAGRGKFRGRRYRVKTGLLIVVSKGCPLEKAANNISGIDVAQVRNINAETLAPGGVPGRITLWTENSIKELKDHKLFV